MNKLSLWEGDGGRGERSIEHLLYGALYKLCYLIFKKPRKYVVCRGPAPADPGYSKRGQRRRGSGYNSFK